ncbi:MAG: thermonuclease family protein, partial [Ilumatobacter sp.]|nr:thermonuclease family protein [Ilumatobacter sp.]
IGHEVMHIAQFELTGMCADIPQWFAEGQAEFVGWNLAVADGQQRYDDARSFAINPERLAGYQALNGLADLNDYTDDGLEYRIGALAVELLVAEHGWDATTDVLSRLNRKTVGCGSPDPTYTKFANSFATTFGYTIDEFSDRVWTYAAWASGDASVKFTQASPDAATVTLDAEVDTTPSPTTGADTVSSTPPDSTLPSPPTTIEPAVPGVVITSWTIVDGDTINTDGQSIRILGYDTPERGECGYDEAGEFLADLLATGTVSLVADSGDDTDRYGRLLRHVLVDGKPVGLSMIEAGKANARYDALDGYLRHRYQDRYRDADSANTFSCVVVSLPQTSSSAEPWNQPGPDLDCSDIGRKVRIAGIDYHRLDSDGDGWGCESYG